MSQSFALFLKRMPDCHYIDVIMTAMASQITSLTVVYSTVYSDADQRKHQSSTSLASVWGIHRDRWIPRTQGQSRGKCLHFMTSSCVTTDVKFNTCGSLMSVTDYQLDHNKPQWNSIEMQNFSFKKMHLKCLRQYGSHLYFDVYSEKIANLVDSMFLPVSPIRISTLVPFLHGRTPSSSRSSGCSNSACVESRCNDQMRLLIPGFAPMWYHWHRVAGNTCHDDVKKWKRSMHSWPFLRWIPITWGHNDAELWCFLWC